ncbi:MAG: hypothetical protein HOP11_03650 [Saprospiraceae bacterium]|nr:hypothetical protein [Saprospiraceae bacterium]
MPFNFQLKYFVLILILIVSSCNIGIKPFNNKSKYELIRASIYTDKYPYVLINNGSEIEGHGYLTGLIRDLNLFDTLVSRSCYKEDIPFVNLSIKKRDKSNINIDDLNRILQDSFGFIIEKEDYWLEKFYLSLYDSLKLNKKLILEEPNQLKNPKSKFSYLEGGYMTTSSLEDYFSNREYQYCPFSYHLKDTIPKKGINIKDVNMRRRSEFRKYNNRVLPFEAQFIIVGELNNFAKKKTEYKLIDDLLEGNLEHLSGIFYIRGIKVDMEVEVKTRHVLKCIK